MSMTKRLYFDFLDKVGIHPDEDNGLIRFSHEQSVNQAFREFTEAKTASVRKHKTDKIENIRQEEGDWV